MEARRRGMSVEEAQQAAFNVRMQDMALLLAMDPIQNLLAFGPGALLQKTMKKKQVISTVEEKTTEKQVVSTRRMVG